MAETPQAGRPTWPTIIGVVSIFLGVLSLACNLPVGYFYTFHVDANYTFSPTQASLASLERPFTCGLLVQSTAGAILLFAAGILLIGRRTAARPLHLVYAWVTLAATAFDVMGTWIMFFANSSHSLGFADPTIVPWSLFYLVWCGLYPIFLLAWFNRKNVRQQVNEWKSCNPKRVQPGGTE
jgi:hypothetical protein